jgi:predicted ABC-type ATPase
MHTKTNLLDSNYQPATETLGDILEAVRIAVRSKSMATAQRLKEAIGSGINPVLELTHPARHIDGITAPPVTSTTPTLVLVAGPNGSGKTSFVTQLIEQGWVSQDQCINADNMAQTQFGGWNSLAAALSAATAADDLREQLLAQRKSMLFETVFSIQNKLDFIRRAKQAGYVVRVFVFCTNHPAINAERVARRVMEGGHDVPITKIISRYPKSLANCAAAAALADHAYLIDNSINNAAPKLILETAQGKVTETHGEVAGWTEILTDMLPSL